MRRTNGAHRMTLSILAAFTLLAVYSAIHTCDRREPQSPAVSTSATSLTVTEHKLAKVFIKHGSPDPVGMAQAVAATKRKRLMTAVAIIESRGTPWAKGKAGEYGAFQVIPREWGPVPIHPKGQAEQAEKILEEILSDCHGSIRKTLTHYNGGCNPGPQSERYAERVMAEIEQVKL